MDYEDQAQTFLQETGTGLSWTRGSKTADWSPSGFHYRVKITNGGASYSFDFWDCADNASKGKRPTAYDILSCVASDSYYSKAELIDELGLPFSQALKALEHAKQIVALFTPKELEQLREIQ